LELLLRYTEICGWGVVGRAARVGNERAQLVTGQAESQAAARLL